MLAYVFWHRPRPAVATAHYEASLLAFHAALAAHPPDGFHGSHALRIGAAPWLRGDGSAYEDWYLVEDWGAVGVLNAGAVNGPRRPSHDTVAFEAGDGAGGIYRRVLGAPRPTGAHATWFAKPRGMSASELGEALDALLAHGDGAVWQRQMVLGPAPEFCLLTEAPAELGWATTAVARTELG